VTARNPRRDVSVTICSTASIVGVRDASPNTLAS